LQRELSDIVGRLRDPRVGFVTVMDVELSPDLHYATMFVSVLGGEAQRREALEALEGSLGYIRREVAQRVRLRQAPEISVRYDDTSERAARVSAVINSLSIPPAEDESPSAS
jgi:ribosome-binding factor A